MAKFKSISQYDFLPCKNRKLVKFKLSKLEKELYSQVQDECIRKKKSEGETRTILSDLITTFDSKKNQIQKILTKNIGKSYVFFNLKTEAKKFEFLCGENNLVNVHCKSYKLNSEDNLSDADILIYAEHPIIQAYYFIAIESQLKRNAKVFYVQSDATVETELEAKLSSQLQRVEQFVEECVQVKK